MREITVPDVAIRLTNRRLQIEMALRCLTAAQTRSNQDAAHLRASINEAICILEEAQEW